MAGSRSLYDGMVISSTHVPAASLHSHCRHDDAAPVWGARGHGLIQEVAVETLPKDSVPEFFTENKERLTDLASQPDRWKPTQLSYLRKASSLDHFLAYEQVKGIKLPADRYDFIAQVQEEGLSVPGAAPKFVGFLPYRVAELYQNLTLDFALWRKEGSTLPEGTPRREALEQNALYTAGLLGHYIEDASQPLHSTVHHDAWNTVAAGGNPKGFRTQRGLHREFETQLVNAKVDEEQVRERVAPLRRVEGDPLEWGLGIVAESNSQVERLYTLEKNGELKASQPSAAAVDFMHDRMAVGAQNLRDLWHSAWLDSEKLAKEIGPPQ